MKDKLDVLLDLINNSEQSKRYSNPFEDILSTISNNNDAFFFLYESMPEGIKPDLNTCSDNFRSCFLDVIKKEDEKTFNSYFFSGMHKHFDVDKIRELQFKFPENKQLNEYWKTIDTPKNVDEVIEFLAELWLNNSADYQSMFKHYLPQLEKINKNTSPKSRTADRFSWWARQIIERDGIPKFFEFCKEIKVEPVSFCINADKSLSLYIQKISIEDLNFLLKYSEEIMVSNPNLKIKYSFEAIEKMFSYGTILSKLHDLTYQNEPGNKEKFALLWKSQQEYIKSSLYKHLSFSKLKPTDSVEKIAIELLNSDFAFDNRGYSSSIRLYKDNIKDIIAQGKIADLDLPPSAKSIDSKKHKL